MNTRDLIITTVACIFFMLLAMDEALSKDMRAHIKEAKRK